MINASLTAIRARRLSVTTLTFMLISVNVWPVFSQSLPINDIQVFYEVSPFNNRGDEGLSIDGDIDSFSYLTPSFTVDPNLVSFDFGGSSMINRLRVAKYADIDGSGDADNVDLRLLYTTDTGPLEMRSFLPVTGLANGYLGTELINADAVNASDATVNNDHHDFDQNSYYSLTFDPVMASGFALRIARDAADSEPWVHYATREFEFLQNDIPRSISDIQILPALDPPHRDNTRGDAGLAIDQDSFTLTYLTAGGTVGPQIVAFDLGGLNAINRFRADKVGDVDASPDGAPGLAPIDNMDLKVLYSTDTGPLAERSYQPVSGLTSGYLGSEFIEADSVSAATATVDNDHHDSIASGPYSLTFDTVNATAFAFQLERDAADSSRFVHYGSYELEVLKDSTPRAVNELQVFAVDLPPSPGDIILNNRGDQQLAIDQDTTTFSYLTPSGTSNPNTVALDIGQVRTVDRLRVAKLGDLEGFEGIDNADLEILYTTDSGPLDTRSYQPVTGLVSGSQGAELINAEAVNAEGSVEKDHHDFGTDGWYSLSFDAVAATGLAVRFARSAGDPNTATHYPTFEFEIYAAGAGGTAGDFNGDGNVDMEDLAAWRIGFGETVDAMLADGDADNDGDVDGGDFLLWQRNLGAGDGAAAMAAPEPSGIFMLLAGVLSALVGLRSRRGSQ